MVQANVLEEALIEYFTDVQLTDGIKTRVLQKIENQHHGLHSKRELTQLQNQLERTKKLYLMGDLTEAMYRQEKTRLESALIESRPNNENQDVDLDEAIESLRSMGNALRLGNDGERKQLFQTVLDEVYVKDKKVVAIRPKPKFYNLLSCHVRTRRASIILEINNCPVHIIPPATPIARLPHLLSQ